jgi:hypothetical protein
LKNDRNAHISYFNTDPLKTTDNKQLPIVKQECSMTAGSDISPKHIAFYDPERKGIFIHNDQLKESPFEIGDRFSVRKGKRELFAMTLIKDDTGEIFYDKNGIFIERTRKIDILLGGIFDEYVIYIEPEIQQTIKIKALEIVRDNSQKWF